MSQISNKWLKYALTISLAGTPLIGTESFAKGACHEEIVKACHQAQSNVVAQQQAGMQPDPSTKIWADKMTTANNTAAFQGQQVAIDCANLADECDTRCSTPQEKKACKEAVNQKASDIKAQSVANTQNGSNSGMMSALMGAAMGGAMAYMMAKQQQQNQPPPPPPPQPIATGALQLNGSLNCQMQDSYRYEDCNSFLAQFCQSQATAAAATQAGAMMATPMTGAVISQAAGVLPTTPDCASFTANYCATSVTPPMPYGNVRQDGSITQVNLAGTGEGLGTPYCGNAVASQWCNDPLYASQRMSCPACRQMQTNNSATCAANPALCLAQNSPQQMAAVTVGSACSGDPLYTPGSPYALPGLTGTATTLVAGQTTMPGAGLPVVVLPSSTAPVGSGMGLPVAGPPVTGGGIAVTSAAKKAGMREGRGVASTSSAGTSELIAAGGVIVAGGPSGVSRGPASDVEAKFGPSLFATTSSVVRQHCQAGKLNNCP